MNISPLILQPFAKRESFVLYSIGLFAPPPISQS